MWALKGIFQGKSQGNFSIWSEIYLAVSLHLKISGRKMSFFLDSTSLPRFVYHE